MSELTPEEAAVIKRVLLTAQLQNLIGADEWDLTEDEENVLWEIIRKLEAEAS